MVFKIYFVLVYAATIFIKPYIREMNHSVVRIRSLNGKARDINIELPTKRIGLNKTLRMSLVIIIAQPLMRCFADEEKNSE